jgi:formylglycine-generating enzyme required for sulfatase activity
LLDLVDVPGGVFAMGSTLEEVERCVGFWSEQLVEAHYKGQFRNWILKEYPCRDVRMEPFRMSRFPVTNGDYRAFTEATGALSPESLRSGEADDHPVWGVAYDDAEAYAGWAASRYELPCALPTEEQWEYAARGPSRREFPFGDDFDPSLCNTAESGIGGTTAVDRYPRGASAFGIFDMAGNVEEWTCSRYRPYPGGAFIEDDLSRTLGPDYRILRGGSFARGGDLARCARRHGPLPRPPFRFTGFRLVAAG